MQPKFWSIFFEYFWPRGSRRVVFQDVDPFYEEQKTSLIEYCRRVNLAARHCELVVGSIKRASNYMLKIAVCFGDLATQEGPEINK